MLIVAMVLYVRRRRKKAFILKTKENVLYIRYKLKTEEVCTETFTRFPPILDLGDIFNFYKIYKRYTQMKQFKWDNEFFSEVKARTFTKTEDVELIDEYNNTLKKRDKHIVHLLKSSGQAYIVHLLKSLSKSRGKADLHHIVHLLKSLITLKTTVEDDEELIELNKECLRLADLVLNKIKWSEDPSAS